MTRRPFMITCGLVASFWLAGLQGGAPNLRAQAAATPAATAQNGRSSPQTTMADMMKRRQQMMADQKAGDAKLDELVTAMNAASSDGKTAAIAQVVTELVRQQKAMHEQMGMNQQLMMDMMGGRGMMRGR